MELKGKVALITGGARIGQAVAKALADRGAHLILTYRTSKSSAQESQGYAEARGRQVLLIKTDLTLNKDIADIISKARRVFRRLDILINMASIYEETPLKSLNLKTWDRNMNANLKHVYDLSIRAAGLMRSSGGGRIINFTDWTVVSERPRYKNFAPYYAAKSGVKGLTEALALELAPDILVNAIAPGPIIPPKNKMTAKEKREVVQVTPLKRWGGAEEIAKAALFLIDSDFVTGECIRVDGGRHLY
ncbi:MAG: SDR family oxidoreductase [Candidatus Omnitrophica bacterium]|nr:SDR family oxidoreductase [Candidatus Omnitrophota bacterium]